MKWSKERHRELTTHECVTDLDIFNVLTLSLLINRRVPEHFTDDEVSQSLRRVVQTHSHLIPWRVPWLKQHQGDD
jgi:hypothetical protein